eukprot:sb/3470639/
MQMKMTHALGTSGVKRRSRTLISFWSLAHAAGVACIRIPNKVVTCHCNSLAEARDCDFSPHGLRCAEVPCGGNHVRFGTHTTRWGAVTIWVFGSLFTGACCQKRIFTKMEMSRPNPNPNLSPNHKPTFALTLKNRLSALTKHPDFNVFPCGDKSQSRLRKTTVTSHNFIRDPYEGVAGYSSFQFWSRIVTKFTFVTDKIAK